MPPDSSQSFLSKLDMSERQRQGRPSNVVRWNCERLRIKLGTAAERLRSHLSRHSAAMADLAPNGSMALLLANDSMSSNSSGEGDIRRVPIEADLIETATLECAPLKFEGIPQVVSSTRDNMVALPGQLFTNTQIPTYIWFLTKNKAKRTRSNRLRKSILAAAFSDQP